MKRSLFACVVVWAVGAAIALGQGAPAASPGEAYRIQPEDGLRIQVYNEPQASADVPVDRNGNISAPFVGLLHVAGKTAAQVEAELYDRYKERLRIRDPRVSVIVIGFRRLRASVGGMVARPGQYEFRPGDTIMTLISAAGGANPDRADLRRVTLRRGVARELIPIDLYAMQYQYDTSQNYELQDGDELTVPEETLNRVLVMGEVQQQGVYPYREPMTLADAIAMARGPIPIRSKMSETRVIRRVKGDPDRVFELKVNFVRYQAKGDASQNIRLQPGDVVFVPGTKTPDLNYISALANTAFIIDRFGGGIFGINIFGR